MTQLKEPLTYSQQIDRLRNVHNLTINDDELALHILQKVSYYRLNAYGIGLTQNNDREKYLDGISIEHIYRLYEFDGAFRSMIFHVVEQLEIQLRTQISNHLALKYGSESYTNPEIFMDTKEKDGTPVHKVIMDSFEKECRHQKNVPFVKHHMHKYEGHFPVWVAMELFTFGNLSSLYKIMVLEDRKEIANLYNTKPKYLGSWILALVEVRNICAHSGRLYNMPLKQSPHLYQENKKYRSEKVNRIFPVLLAMKRMLNSDRRWEDFETRLEELIAQNNNVVRLSYIGFPTEWKEILTSANH